MSAPSEPANVKPEGRGPAVPDGRDRHGQQAAPQAGLWERKKARTRAAIRQQALRLFREQGYDATTVEQIAEAAEVSSSTFFRYFATKEDVVLQDDMDLLWAEAVRAQPAELSPMAALRAAMHDVFAAMSPAQLRQLRESTELSMSVPAVRARSLDEFARTIGVVARLAAERTGRDPDDLEVRAFAGAVMGVGLAAWFAASGDLETFIRQFERAIALLEAGLPM